MYQSALEINPQSVQTFLALGAFYETQQQFPKAEEQARTALSLQPENVDIYLKLARLYAVQGKMSEAEATYREGDPSRPLQPAHVSRLRRFLCPARSDSMPQWRRINRLQRLIHRLWR